MEDAALVLRVEEGGAVEVADAPGRFADWLRAITQDIPDGLTFDEWKEWGQHLRGRQEKIAWKIVQWLMYGEKRYGQTYDHAVIETGIPQSYLKYLKSIGKSTADLRAELPSAYSLPPAHIALVAPLPLQHQKRLVRDCLSRKLSRRQFAASVRDYCAQRQLAPPKPGREKLDRTNFSDYATLRIPVGVYERLRRMVETDGETPESWIVSFVERTWPEWEAANG